jgi:hypothetical protein
MLAIRGNLEWAVAVAVGRAVGAAMGSMASAIAGRGGEILWQT